MSAKKKSPKKVKFKAITLTGKRPQIINVRVGKKSKGIRIIILDWT